MATTRYDPFQALQQVQRDINQLFERRSPGGLEHASDWTPAVDIREEDQRFVLQVDVPGVRPEDIEITMEQGNLTIKGERAAEEQSVAHGFTRLERVKGSFFRRFSLPDSADADNVEAKTVDGVLEVVIPKREKAKPRTISVEG